MKSICVIILTFFCMIATTVLAQEPVEIELLNSDWGLVYNDYTNPDPLVQYGILQEYHGGLHPDLRIGQRNSIIYRSFFVFNLNDIPGNATINSVRVKFDPEDTGNWNNISGIYLVSYEYDCFPYDDCFNNYIQTYESLPYPVLDQIYTAQNDDPIVTHIQSLITDPFNAELGLKLFLDDESINGNWLETTKVRVWVTYEEPVQAPDSFQVTVQNSFGGGNIIVIENGNEVQYPSGATFLWEEGSQHTLKAFNHDWPSSNNYFRVFQNEWKKDLEPFSSENPITITVLEEATYRAEFLRRFDFEVENEFTDGGNGGIVKVNDQVKPAPDSITIIEGEAVEVQAPTQTQTVNGKQITYNFLRWQDGDTENPRDFVPNDHANITATYKGHLVTLETDATASNNQRKMVWDDVSEKYHMVYEDGGDIYYTTTAGPDNAWTAEEPVAFDPDPNYQYAFPAVTAENGIVVIVWQERNVGFSNIYLRVKDAAGWHDEKLVANFVFGSTGDPVAAPVVAKATEPGVFLVVWHDYIFNNLRIRAYDYSKDTFGEITDIPSTNGNSMYPSLAEDRFHDEHLVWEESGDIYYTKFDHYFDVQGEEHYVWHISKEKVSSGTGYSEHVFPSVTTDYDTRPNVVWQAYSGPALESQIILHRRRESSGGAESTWSSVTSFIGNDSYYKPSITGFPGVSSNQELRAVWRRDDNSIWVGKYNGNSWSTIYTWLYGFDPNVSGNMSADMAAKMVFRNSGFSPYTLTTTSNNLSNTPPPTERFAETTTGEDVRHRRGVLTMGNGEIAFELGAFEIDGNPVNLFAYSDTLIVNRHKQWAELFRTEVFPVSDRAELRYFRGFEILNRDTLRNVIPPGAKLEFRLEAIDVQSQRVLATLDRQVITRNIPPDFREYKTISFRLSDPGEVYLRVGLGLPEGLDIRQSMVEAHYESDEDSLAKQFAGDKLSAELTPARFELEQNYPNPFNPQTTIRFALPEPALVKLEIYDITGRKIRELINNALKAGFYDVKWDGKDQTGMQVTSGMYIYRIKAGDFVKSRKLMLIR